MTTHRSTISVRLDGTTDMMLQGLLEHYDSLSISRVTASDVLRRLIQERHRELFSRDITRPTT